MTRAFVKAGAAPALATALTLALTLGAPGIATAAQAAPFASCEEAAAAGQTDIPRGSPAYSEDLDRDGDGIACESDGSSGSVPVRDSDGDDDDGDAAADDGGAESSDDQVSIVPEGGAPTGDGSAQGATALWWIGGGVIAVVGAGMASRRRPDGRTGLAGR